MTGARTRAGESAGPGRRAVLSGLVLAPLLGACGSAPEPVHPGGVDDLVVPTPEPDPADFVDAVDNPWLPLAEGASWTYAAANGASVLAVVTGVVEVAGVDAAQLRWTGRARPARVGWFAQDRDGNVWQLGGETLAGKSWRAGEAGARAGLAMPALPRRGDGFRVMQAPGVAEDLLTVASIRADAPTGLPGEYADRPLVELRRTSALESALSRRELYAQGVGLVAINDEAGATPELLLEDRTGSDA